MNLRVCVCGRKMFEWNPARFARFDIQVDVNKGVLGGNWPVSEEEPHCT